MGIQMRGDCDSLAYAGVVATPAICHTPLTPGLYRLSGAPIGSRAVLPTFESKQLDTYHLAASETGGPGTDASIDVTLAKARTGGSLADLREPGTLRPLNRLVLETWHSLRRGTLMPARASFDPRRLLPALTRLCILDVLPGQDIIVRLVGTMISSTLGRNLTGVSLRTLTPVADWPYRQQAIEHVLDGFAFVGTRVFPMKSGAALRSQELILPFADIRAGGWRQVLVANDFPPPSLCVPLKASDEILDLTCDDRFFKL